MLLIGLWFGAAHFLFIPTLPPALQSAAALLLLGLPGGLFALALFYDEPWAVTRLFLVLWGAVLVAGLLLFALQAVPGPLLRWQIVACCDLLSIGAGIMWLRRPAVQQACSWRTPFGFVAVPIVAYGSALRLIALGSAEFQGDEGRAMLMATGVLHGQDAILLLHKKGPLEVVFPAGMLSLLQTINESSARLPFAIAAIGVLIGGVVLARDLFAWRGERQAAAIGVLAGALLAVDGYLIAFGRIVQYQSVLLLMQVGAIWCFWRFYTGAHGPRRYLFGGAIAAAVGLLAHYDTLFVIPALAWLAVAGARRRGWTLPQGLRALLPPALGAAALVASFYVPFVRDPHFQQTARYLAMRSGYDGTGITFYNNLPGYFVSAIFYNTIFQIIAAALILAGSSIGWLWLVVRPRWLGVGCIMLLALGCALLLLAPKAFAAPGIGNWALAAFGLPLVALVVAPATPAALRALLLWFGSGFVAMAFLLVEPNTHFYVMDVAAALLISAGVVQGFAWLDAHPWRWLRLPLAAGGIVVLLVAAPYPYLLFVRQEPEQWRTFPRSMPAVYRLGNITKRLKGSFFGLPHHVGWPIIGDLYAHHVLEGSYFSNEEELITGWYTHAAYRCATDPDYYFLSARPLDPIPLDEQAIRRTYHLFGRVLVDGTVRMEIYRRAALEQPTQTFDLREHSAAVDQGPVVYALWDALALPLFQYPAQDTWQNGAQLVGYDLAQQQLAIGQTTTMALYWQGTAHTADDATIQIELRDQNGAHAGFAQPYCHTQTDGWDRAAPSPLGFRVTAGAQMPPGTYTLHVVLRSRADATALPLRDGSSDALVGRITVRPTEDVPDGWTLAVPAPAVDFGPDLHLRTAARDTTKAATGWLRYRLFWQTAAAPHHDLMLFAHVLAANGDRVAQVDLPLDTHTWAAQQLYSSVFGVPLPPNLPPGAYRLVVGIYDPATGQRLPLRAAGPQQNVAGAGNDALLLTTVDLP